MFLKSKFLIFISIILFIAGSAFANRDFHWEFAGWEGGGCFSNIEFDPNIKNRVYLTSDVAGIWRSDDLGEHWRFITSGLRNLYIPAISVAPSDSNILYAASKDDLYLSVDAGETWKPTQNFDHQIKFSRPQSYKPLAVSPLNPKNICIGTARGKVLCSRDSGQNWTDLDPKREFLTGEKAIAVVLYTFDAKNLWIGGENGILNYDFAEKSLKLYRNTSRNITDMELSWDNKIILAAADGITFFINDENSDIQPTFTVEKKKVYRIALKITKNSDKEPFQALAAFNHGWNGWIMTTNDQGLWKSTKTQINPDSRSDPTWAWANVKGKIASLKVDPHDSNVAFMTNWWGVFRSDDGGAIWNEKIHGAPNTVGSDIKVAGDTVWVATMDNGLLKSLDGGQSYQTVFPSVKYDHEKSGHVWRVIVPQDNVVIATSSPWNNRINQVIVSEDGGKTFKIVGDGLPKKRPAKNTMWGEGYPRALAFDHQNPKRIYLGIDGDDGGGLFVSDDSGLTWTRSQGQPDGLRIYNGLAVDPTNSQRLFWGACGKDGGVYVSSDGGKTWRRTLKKMLWVFDLQVADDGTIYAAGDVDGPAVFISRDHGKSWEKTKLAGKGAAEALAVDPTNQNRIAVSTVQWNAGASGKVFLSSDAGATWTELTGDLPAGAGAAASAFSSDGKYLYISRYAGSVYRLKIN